jgi:hypothetical protein
LLSFLTTGIFCWKIISDDFEEFKKITEKMFRNEWAREVSMGTSFSKVLYG